MVASSPSRPDVLYHIALEVQEAFVFHLMRLDSVLNRSNLLYVAVLSLKQLQSSIIMMPVTNPKSKTTLKYSNNAR